eukprot:TRINITY_DN9365_c0_g1_i1.p1 TRINITY_DN9365_c0_g1~~TRINITY_DN9365_c0_g1_i1.p1  ORF type:complete len:1046 (+),score=140.85 TRINITY_DN9365_c0_g1_i1:87-3224(+)
MSEVEALLLLLNEPLLPHSDNPTSGVDSNAEIDLCRKLCKQWRKQRHFCHQSSSADLYRKLWQSRLQPAAKILSSDDDSKEKRDVLPCLIYRHMALMRIMCRDSTLIGTSELTQPVQACILLCDFAGNRYVGGDVGTIKAIDKLLLETSCVLSKLSDEPAGMDALAQCQGEVVLTELVNNSHSGVLQNALHVLYTLMDANQAKATEMATTNLPMTCLEVLQDYAQPWAVHVVAARILAKLSQEDLVQKLLITHGAISTCIACLQERQAILLLPIVQMLSNLSSSSAAELRTGGAIPALALVLQRYSPELDASPDVTPSPSPEGDGDHQSSRVSTLLCSICAIFTDLARSEINAIQLQECNTIYFSARLLVTAIQLTPETQPMGLRKKTSSVLQCYVLRLLRFLFAVVSNRRYFKRIFPPDLFAKFIDIGHYKYDLALYRPLAKALGQLSTKGVAKLQRGIQETNITLEPNKRIRCYNIFEVLGSGSFGRVFRVQEDGKKNNLALKEIPLKNPLLGQTDAERSSSLTSIENEVKIMREGQLKHPNVVLYKSSFKQDDNLYIVMELIEGASLLDHVNAMKEKAESFTDKRVMFIATQICNGLRYIHKEKKVVHRDLTPANVMLGWDDKVTITDFGLARKGQTGHTLMQSSVGTLCYSCPEIVTSQPYGAKSDIWSLGCILYQLATLEPPFNTTNMLALAKRIVEAKYDPLPDVRPRLLHKLVGHCLNPKPEKRPDIDEVCHLLGPVIMEQLNEAIRTIEVKDQIIQVERAKRHRHQSEAQAQKTSFKQLLRFAQGSGYLEHSRLPSVADDVASQASSRAASARDIATPLTGAFADEASLTRTPPRGLTAPSPLARADKNDSLGDVFDDGASSPGSLSRSPSFRNMISETVRSHMEGSTRSMRPNSGTPTKSLLIPASELRPMQDPMSQVLHCLHKLNHVCSQPAPATSDPLRHVLIVFKRAIFADTSVTLRSHLQQLSAAKDTIIPGLDFGPAARAVSRLCASSDSRTDHTDLSTEPQEQLHQRNHLTYRVLAKALEAKAKAADYYV